MPNEETGARAQIIRLVDLVVAKHQPEVELNVRNAKLLFRGLELHGHVMGAIAGSRDPLSFELQRVFVFRRRGLLGREVQDHIELRQPITLSEQLVKYLVGWRDRDEQRRLDAERRKHDESLATIVSALERLT